MAFRHPMPTRATIDRTGDIPVNATGNADARLLAILLLTCP